MLNIDQEKLNREFANEFINAVSDMREKMNAYYKLKKQSTPPTHLRNALQASITAEQKVDAMIEAVTIKEKKHTLFGED